MGCHDGHAVVTPKPPRDDDRTPPDRPRVQTPKGGVAVPRVQTDPHGVRITRPITERGSIPADYERHTPARGMRTRSESWDEDVTPPTTDPALYRAVRELKKQTTEQSTEIAVIRERVWAVDESVKTVDRKTDQQTIEIATIKGSIQSVVTTQERAEKRTDIKLDRVLSVQQEMAKTQAVLAAKVNEEQETLTVKELTVTATQTAKAATEETLAHRLLTHQERKQKFWDRFWVKVVGGLGGGGAITVAVAGLLALAQGKC